MRSLGAFVLLAGIGVGLFVYLPAPVDRSTTLEEARRVSAERFDETRAARSASDARPGARLASFSPGVVLKARQPAGSSAAPAARVETVSNWQTNVSSDLDANEPDGRYKLVVDIQQELKRAGCYWGRVNGAWNASTRQAMLEFNTRSNAALPVDKPDYMLLSLVKSYGGRSCGAVEATTAAASNAPETLPWKAASASGPATSTRLFTPVQSSVVTTAPLPGRMAIGAPLTPAMQEPLVPGNSSSQPTVAALESNERSYQPPAAAAPKPRSAKKSSHSRRASPGTPRYNLMLSLGGVY
ncbi:Peptidoglycan-binding protein [Hyphomicrobium sp. 1Nfss2.1]|uniref:peptidoglycan-binding domain-containing protein n=1 Tax=Hyphomicrobium sp. 1Nfss2.1 TaxID=3413936 RepID=UPI003C7DCF6F